MSTTYWCGPDDPTMSNKLGVCGKRFYIKVDKPHIPQSYLFVGQGKVRTISLTVIALFSMQDHTHSYLGF